MAAAKTGVSFDGIHTYTEWGLRLKEIVIGTPEVKTAYVEIAGMDGLLDLTEAQNGGVRYGMRTLDFIFDARGCSYRMWTDLLSKIATALHGQKKKIVLDIDPEYYYEGRCSINTEKTDEVLAQIAISCYCDPYKLSVISTDQPWIWDTFSFVDGIIRYTADIQIDSGTGWQDVRLIGYPKNTILKIISSAPVRVRYDGATYTLVAGENIMWDIELGSGEQTLSFSGTGVITIVQRGGMI